MKIYRSDMQRQKSSKQLLPFALWSSVAEITSRRELVFLIKKYVFGEKMSAVTTIMKIIIL